MKPRFPRADAIAVAREIIAALTPATEQLIVAGSLRRLKAEVGDIEILFIPRISLVENLEDWFGPKLQRDEADTAIEALLAAGILTKRPNVLGRESWGPKNKFAIHTASGIPVDLFTATAANWHNYLVCRTGSAENNLRIATAAQSKGWKWHPYGTGFTGPEGQTIQVHSERDVFTYAGLPYIEPCER